MSRPALHAAFFVALLAGVLGLSAPALGADTPFSQRYAQTMRGSIEAVGNQLLTCPTATAGCTNARNRTGSTATMNNNYNMRYVDIDGDGSTVNSSTATLTLPAGATVTWAGLYWGADTSAGSGGSPAPNATNRGTVSFKAGSGAYQSVTANGADILTSTGAATRYRAFANVTSLVAGNGTYTVGNVQTGRGDDRWAGWSLVVAYQDATQNVHRVSVYDGLGTVDATHTFSTNIAPFFTPESGTVATKTGLLAFEGDAGLQTEVATFNGNTLTDPLNTLNNLMNSSMTVDGVYISGRTPSYNNTQGTDIDVFNSTGLLANRQSSATLAFSSTQDLFVPSALWLVSDEGPAAVTAGPTIGGLNRDGSTLTANPGTWNGTPTITYEYQWQRCDASGNNCVDIPGATGSTYTLGPDDVGSTVRVFVTAVNEAGSSNPAASVPTSTITKLPPSNVTVPVVSGTLEDGATLTTTLGSWNGTAPLDYGVQWQRCDSAGNNCADIAGATAWSYVLTGADVGSTIRSEVTASNDAGSATAHSVPSVEVDPVAPVNTVVPPVSGVARDGQTLAAGTGSWTGTDPLAYTYQWQRCDAGGSNCSDIAGQTATTYELTGSDIGHAVRVQVTATNVAGDATAGSLPTSAVIPDPPANTVVPTLSGSPIGGHTLTLDDGSWSGTDPLDYDIVWQRCDEVGDNCVAIPGETGTSYTLTPDDIGSTIRAVVTASNVAGIATAQTAPSAPAEAEAPTNVVAPVVSGTLQDGETLSASTGTWDGTQPIAYTYQWQRCDSLGNNCVNIAGATDPDYTLTGDDIGQVVRVVVTAANDAGSASASSAVGIPVAAEPPANVVAPAITGTPQTGQTLTAQDGDWTGSQPLDATYRWERCDENGANCVDIAGAEDANYVVTDDDAGHTLRLEVTYTNPAGTDTARSAPTAPAEGNPPVNTVAPSISGTPRDGQTLTLDDGDWTGSPTLVPAYQWQRCDAAGANCADIAAETGLTYTLQGADVDASVRAVVTYTNAWGDDTASAAPTAVVAPAPPVITIDPAVVGTAVDGQTVTADPGIWAGTAPVTLEYQWLRCDLDGTNCVEIPGATDDEYTLTGDDAVHGIRVEVTATNAAGTAAATSPVAAVDAAAPQNTAIPTISGGRVDGSTLTADEGNWSGTGPIDYDYTWLRCDADGSNCVAIPGANSDTYILGPDDIGHDVRVSVSASNVAGAAQATSDPSGEAVEADPPANTVAPTVSGTPEDGSTLTAGTGGWSGTLPIDFDYQWQRCDADGTDCADIAGETGSTYDLTDADVGHAIVVVVTASNAAGDDSAASVPTTAVLPAPPVNTTQPPAPTGDGVDGGTLTADPGTWTGDGPIDYEYQWQRCDADGTDCEDIDGADEDTYVLGQDDAGHAIVVVVTATNPGGSSSEASAPTTPISAAPPVSLTPPSVSGDPVDSGTLTVDPGTYSGTGPIDYEYEWQRCDADGTNCVEIAGETGSSYILGPDDIGHTVVVVVTAGNAGGETTETSPASPVVEPAPPHDAVAPVITGDVTLGEELAADTGSWTGTAPVTFEYQWQRCDADGENCEAIAGATEDTYELTEDDQGHTVVVVVTATNDAGTDTATSEPSAPLPAPPHNTVAPTIDGDTEVGSVLTADPGTWTGTGPLDYDYVWQRCDFFGNNCVDIPGATGDTYTLTGEDLGHTIHVIVSASNDAGSEDAAGPVSPALTDPEPEPTPTPTPTPTATPSPTPTATPTPTPTATPTKPSNDKHPGAGNTTPSGPIAADSVFGGFGGDDLGSVPGSLVSDTSCQQLAGNSKYSRVKAKGIGTVRVRAYATGPATQVSPVLVTTQISGGKAKKVTYKLDGKKLKAKKRGWKSAITPKNLQKVGVHILKATIKGKKKGAKKKVVTLKLKTVTCRTLFTAQRWRTTAGFGLRLRIDARSAMQKVSFKVPAALLPRQVKKARVIGFMRVFVAGERGRRRFSLKLAKTGKKTPLVKGVGKPTVKLRKGKIDVIGLPERAAVTELTLYREKKFDGNTKRRVYKLRARVAPTGGSLSVRPQAPR